MSALSTQQVTNPPATQKKDFFQMASHFSSYLCGFVFALSISTLHASDLEAFNQLQQVAAKARLHQQTRFAFTLSSRDLSEDSSLVNRQRFDPRRSEGARWSLQGEGEAKVYQDKDADRILTYPSLYEKLQQAILVEETEARATFSLPVKGDDKVPDGVMEMLISLDRVQGYVDEIRIHATKKFKPMMVATVHSFEQVMRYAPPQDAGPALLVSRETRVEGKAMFMPFSQHQLEEFSAIEEMQDALPRASKE